MAKATNAVSIQDLVANMANVSAAAESIKVEVATKLTKADAVQLTKEMFTALEISRDAGIEAEKLGKTVKKVRGEQNQLAVQRFAILLTHIPVKELKDRSEEGVKNFNAKFDETRYGFFLGQYSEVLEKEGDKYLNRDGNEMGAKFKNGQWKMGSHPFTSIQWNVLSKMRYYIERYGWAECMKGKTFQKLSVLNTWSLDSDGKVVKEKVASTPGKAGAKSPLELVNESLATLKARFERLAKEDMPAAEKLAMEIQMVPTTILVNQKAKAAAKS